MLEAQLKTAKVEEGSLLLDGKSLFTPLVTQIFETLPDEEGATQLKSMFMQLQRAATHWAGGLTKHANEVAAGKINIIPNGGDLSTEDSVMDVPVYDSDTDDDDSDVELPFPEKDVLNKADVIQWKADQKKALAEQNAKRKEKKEKRKTRDKAAKKAFKGMQDACLTTGNKVTIPIKTKKNITTPLVLFR